MLGTASSPMEDRREKKVGQHIDYSVFCLDGWFYVKVLFLALKFLSERSFFKHYMINFRQLIWKGVLEREVWHLTTINQDVFSANCFRNNYTYILCILKTLLVQSIVWEMMNLCMCLHLYVFALLNTGPFSQPRSTSWALDSARFTVMAWIIWGMWVVQDRWGSSIKGKPVSWFTFAFSHVSICFAKMLHQLCGELKYTNPNNNNQDFYFFFPRQSGFNNNLDAFPPSLVTYRNTVDANVTVIHTLGGGKRVFSFFTGMNKSNLKNIN